MHSDKQILLGLSTLVAALAVASLMVGTESIKLGNALADQFARPDSTFAIILREIRLPRMLIAAIIGASLGLCGAAMQGLLRNPLASPGLVGSASGAALGAVSVLYFSNAIWHTQLIPLAGMAGSLCATLLVYLLAGRGAGITTLILAGVAVNALATALLSLLLNLAPSPLERSLATAALYRLGMVNALRHWATIEHPYPRGNHRQQSWCQCASLALARIHSRITLRGRCSVCSWNDRFYRFGRASLATAIRQA